MAVNLDDDKWKFRFTGKSDKEIQATEAAIQAISRRIPSDDAISLEGKSIIYVVIENFLANENITNQQLIEANTVTSEDISNSFSSDELKSEQYIRDNFDDYDLTEGHLFSVDLLHTLTGVSKKTISRQLAGLGRTGTTGPATIYADFSQLFLLGTALHDVTSYLDDIFNEKNSSVKSFNQSLYGTDSLVGSALIIGATALAKNTFDLKIGNNNVDEALEVMGESFGSQLAKLFGGENLFEQTAASTIGGALGKELVKTLNNSESSLLAKSLDSSKPNSSLVEISTESVLEARGDVLLNDFRAEGTKALGTLITAELADALDLKGFHGQLLALLEAIYLLRSSIIWSIVLTIVLSVC